MASPEVVTFFKGRKRNHGLLDKLNITMNSVSGVLDDAEEKQVNKLAVRKWLDELKEAVFEADDLLDEVAYKAMWMKQEAGSRTYYANQVRNFFSSRNPFKKGMQEKLEEILDRLEFLVKQKDILGLREGVGEKPWSHKIPTTSVIDESGVYGRDDDKEAIMKLLLSDDENGSDVDVIPIVGMGGVGKTTVAQLVYNDSRLQDWFDIKVWVCVSEEFDVYRVTKDILKEVTWKKCEAMSLNQLQLELKKRLTGKKFLLVLDDVWKDEYADWDILQTPLKFGAKGSKIIITTRNVSVASIMGTIPSHHHLKELTNDDCWLLFAKHAFDDGNSSAYPNLQAIGREIAKKCKGLPIAAKTLGGLLHSKREVEEWKKILRSNIWDLSNDKILPALRLSYHYLPSHLKPCFAYCAIFPKDYEFRKEELMLLWMAEGFLIGNQQTENVGDEYFDDLVSRSLFQRSSSDLSCFVMHDLINDLAKFVSGEFCFMLEGNYSCKVAKKTRYLSYARTKHDAYRKFEAIDEAQLLRTFFPIDRSHWWWHAKRIDNEVIHDLLPRLKRLRVLCLSQYCNIVALPDSIGSLMHLRYLDLSETRIKRLPDYLKSFYSLQTLILCRCIELEELPTGIVRLINLCHLDIRETKLLEMPPQMGKLTKLQKLTDFIPSKQSGSGINELAELQHLRGELCIWNLQNVVNARDASQANLKGKKHLKKLELRWNNDTGNSLSVLEQLQPCTNVECLSIVGYGSSKFPNWVGHSSFTNIESLRLSGFKHCSFLPPLGQLASLKDLWIAAFDGIGTIGPEFYGNKKSIIKPFGSLKILRFEGMPQWQEWISDVDGAFPLLQELYIRECPILVKALPSSLPSLTTLVIEGCEKLVTSLPKAANIRFKDNSRDVELKRLPCGLHRLRVDRFISQDSLLEGIEQIGDIFSTLEEITIRNYDSFKGFPLEVFPKLKKLDINGCLNLQSLFISEATPGDFSSLGSAEMRRCPHFPGQLIPAPHFPLLQELCVRECPNLTEALPNHLPSLTALKIEGCKQLVVSLPQAPTIAGMILMDNSRKVALVKLPSGLHHLKVDQFRAVDSLLQGVGHADGLSTTLEEIEIQYYDSLKCFPLELFPKLKRLDISRCPNLESFCSIEAIHGDFTSLSSLKIWKCPNLVSFPKGGLPAPYLTCLQLWDCSSLKSLPDCMHSLLPSLANLDIIDCPELESFPEGGLPSNLQSLVIYRCNKLIAGRMQWNLQLLPSITCFRIGMFDDVESFPEEMLLPSSLASLKIRCLQSMKSLNYKGLQHLTSLSELEIYDCPKLQSMPREGLPSSLSSVSICNCPELIAGCMELGLQRLPSLSCFRIDNCKNVESFPDEMLLPSTLTSLEILHLHNLKSLNHKGLLHLTALRELKISNCPKLESMPEEGLPSSLSSLFIKSCPELESFPKRELASKLESLEVWCCDKLISGCMQQNLQMFPHLSQFVVGGCKSLDSFPEETLLPITLTSLKICSLQNLKSLNYNGLQHLTSLRELMIRNCPRLQSMPEEGLPSSLSSLIINNCPSLRQRCERDEGEDWTKISHIFHVDIDGDTISDTKE